ncbi:MAG: AMIN domain-containing protein [Myxacorys chilensis ATA2-1-KO14]|nr:AMIN domain-containing protein [Myxacorys chilensis ATA2-1-KO14]
MKELRAIGVMTAATIALFASQPASAAPTQVSNVRLNPTGSGVDVVLETQGGNKAPQVFNVNRGNTWTAYVFNTQIAQPFQQANPAPGIASVSVNAIGGNGIQVVVVGKAGTPTGQVASRNAQGVILSVASTGGVATAGNGSVAQVTPTVAQAAPAKAPGAVMMQITPRPPSGTPVTPFVPTAQVQPSGAPFVPTAPVPPLLPRAIAPPVGDQSVANIDASPSAIDLGTNERIPRLVLRDAPVREVLALLAKAAGLNLAYSEGSSGAAPGANGAAAKSGGPTISLDIENEAVQDVFNYVLRITCVPVSAQGGAAGGGGQCAALEANRVGRTVFVGTRLPDEARNLVSRTIRLNQVNTTDAAAFLTTQGAETQRPFEQIQIQTVGEGAAARTIETRTPTILALRPTEGTGALVLRGLSVSTNDRLNSITLTGAPKKVEIATNLLTQLDARKRQVSVNVKIVDINLLKTEDFNTSFSFGVGNNFFSVDQGAAVFNFGSVRPPTNAEVRNGLTSAPVTGNLFPSGTTLSPFVQENSNSPFGNPGTGARAPFGTNGNPFAPGPTAISPPTIDGTTGIVTAPGTVTYGLPSLFQFPSKFLSRLQAQVISGNAKVLSDPTVVVQDGESSSVRLTSEVFAGFKRSAQVNGTQSATIDEPIIKEAGLILNMQIDRIDDNGFVTMRVNPVVSSPGSTVQTPQGQITLINGRSVQSGAIRVRDGQTLILSGIIQETDRATVSKVPILGDIPILGSLFRSTNRNKQRQEVIVMLTPRIMDDSDRSTYGYGYVPGKEVREFMQQQQR